MPATGTNRGRRKHSKGGEVSQRALRAVAGQHSPVPHTPPVCPALPCAALPTWPPSSTLISSRALVMFSTTVTPGTVTMPLGSFLISSLGAFICSKGRREGRT